MLRPFTLRRSPLTSHCVHWASTLPVKTPLWFVIGQSHRSQMPSKCGSLEKLFPPFFSQSCHTQQYLMNAGLYLSTSWEKWRTMPECLRYCFNHCTGSEKYFYKERSANAEGTRAHYDFCYCHVFYMALFFLWGCCFHSTSSPWLNQWLMSPIRKNTVLIWQRGCSAVGFVESLRRQNANSKPGLGLPLQKIPCIILIFQSVITLYWLGM